LDFGCVCERCDFFLIFRIGDVFVFSEIGRLQRALAIDTKSHNFLVADFSASD
jgi:hypothetical protein